MPHYVRRAALCAVLLGTSACETVRDLEAQSRVDPQTIALYRLSATPQDAKDQCPVAPTGRYANEYAKKYAYNDRGPGDNHTGAVPLACFDFPGDAAARSAYAAAAMPQGSAYKTASGPQTQMLNARYARNRLASILLKQSDDVCTTEMGRLVSREAMVNTSLSFLTSALAAAGGIVTGQTAHRILSGGAGLSNATRENFDANVYRNVMSSAVAKAIEKERTKQRTDIVSQFTKDTLDYPVDRMVMEVNEYHQTCSFYRGLGLVLEAVSRDENSNEFTRLSGEIASVKEDIADLTARKEKAGAKEKEAIDADLAKKEAELAKLQEARTKIILPEAVEAADKPKADEPPAGPAEPKAPAPPTPPPPPPPVEAPKG